MKKEKTPNFDKVKQEIEYIFENYINKFIKCNLKTLKIEKMDKEKSCLFSFLDEQYAINLDVEDLDFVTKKMLNEILSQLSVIVKVVLAYDFGKKDRYRYRDSLYKSAVLRGIIQWVCASSTNELVYSIIDKFSNWAIRTYERNQVKFGVIICSNYFCDKIDSNLDIKYFLDAEVSALLADGENTLCIVDKEGKILKICEVESAKKYFAENLFEVSKNKEAKHARDEISKRVPLSPLQYSNICEMSNKGNFGIILSSKGDICCFKKQELVLARLNGRWTVFDYHRFVKAFEDILDVKIMSDLLKQIYLSCLDVAFAGTGGCIALILNNKDNIFNILPSLEDYKYKMMITSYYDANFLNIAREVRRELLAVDGACIIDEKGLIYQFGAIIKSVEPQFDGGARAAAACTLSKYGLAIKISADGYIKVYKKGKQVL